MAATLASSVAGRTAVELRGQVGRLPCLLLKDGSRTRLISRNLKDLTADYPHIAAAAASLPDSVLLDGEIVALD